MKSNFNFDFPSQDLPTEGLRDFSNNIKQYIKFKFLPFRIYYKYRAYKYSKYITPELNIINSISDINKVSLDIGANLGFYSLLFSSLAPNGKIFSFEPSTTNFEKLSENIELNKRINIKTFKMAISNKIGNSKLYLAGKENLNDGGNFIDENKKNYDFKTIEFENVQTDTLDNFLDKKIPFQLAKIDTEGHEINVLKGMTYLLENNLKFLLIETDTNFNEISLFLDKYNFKVLKKGNLNSIFEKV